jgi:uncharacterized protein
VTAPGGRDRDAAGRARSDRPRDELGRPLPRSATSDSATDHSATDHSATDHGPRLPDDLTVTSAEAAELGGRLLSEGRPFHAHEVFEAAWKSAPGADRELWRGLAQIAVGLTHARRGNAPGAVALLRRGAGHVAPFQSVPGEVDTGFVAAQAAGIALRIERDGLASVPADDLRLRLRPS